MKRGLLIFLFTSFLFTSFAFAQGASPDTIFAKLQQMERTWAAAVAQHDPLAIAPMLADAFVDTSEDGKLTDRPTYLDDIKKSQARIDSLTLDQMRVQQYGDAAVVTGRYTAKGPEHARPSAGRFTDTFIRIGSEWKWSPRNPRPSNKSWRRCMIARHWRGWTQPQDADAYQSLLITKVLPALKSIAGYRGGYVLRNDEVGESEFVVINFFDSLDAVRRFAGENYTIPVFEPEARKLLSRIEPIAKHYQVRANTV